MINLSRIIPIVLFAVFATCPAVALPPGGYNVWIAANPAMAPKAPTVTDDLSTMVRIHREVNEIPYVSEEGDVWGSGMDCEDYAIEKMKRMMAAGIDRGAMRFMVIMTTPDSVPHVILVVNEKYILDNLSDDIGSFSVYRKYMYWIEGLNELSIADIIANLS